MEFKSKSQENIFFIVNTRNANSFTGNHGYKSMQNIAELKYLDATN